MATFDLLIRFFWQAPVQNIALFVVFVLGLRIIKTWGRIHMDKQTGLKDGAQKKKHNLSKEK